MNVDTKKAVVFVLSLVGALATAAATCVSKWYLVDTHETY
ncbi:hypothetical protein SAMN02910456_00628 [Ruminococcaceae bacterium YRB3002]|nr:hypothetical protein SAMN02910456_00628 [Ruminococcaceae bacterium YRB3002]